MLRWKLFIPLALALTALGLLGSFLWSASASTRSLSAINSQTVADIALDGDEITISFVNGQALVEVFAELDSEQVADFAKEKDIIFARADLLSVDSSMANQIELVVAQAVATKEYYEASVQLGDLASQWGYSAEMVIWEGRIVAEIRDSDHSYIVHRELKEVGTHD